MWENDIPKQNSTPHFSPRGENGRTNHMWQCQSCCLMHCSGTFRYCRDVDNIRTSLALHCTEVKWRKLEGHGPDFQKTARKSFMSSFQHDIFLPAYWSKSISEEPSMWFLQKKLWKMKGFVRNYSWIISTSKLEKSTIIVKIFHVYIF